MKKTILALLGVITLSAQAIAAGNTNTESFSTAKQILERNVYYDHRVTIYCGYEFDEEIVEQQMGVTILK